MGACPPVGTAVAVSLALPDCPDIGCPDTGCPDTAWAPTTPITSRPTSTVSATRFLMCISVMGSRTSLSWINHSWR